VKQGLGEQTIRLTLPRVIHGTSANAWQISYADPADAITVEIRVVGVYEVRGRTIRYTVNRADYYESLFFEGPEILLPPAAFDLVLEQMGYLPGDPPPVGALAGYSVVTVATETTYAH